MQASCHGDPRGMLLAPASTTLTPEVSMRRYETLDDLPRSLREELPEAAQREYLAVYRITWTRCSMGGLSDEAELAKKAHDAAMLEVERQFERDENGQWRQAPVGAEIDKDKIEGRAPDHE